MKCCFFRHLFSLCGDHHTCMFLWMVCHLGKMVHARSQEYKVHFYSPLLLLYVYIFIIIIIICFTNHNFYHGTSKLLLRICILFLQIDVTGKPLVDGLPY